MLNGVWISYRKFGMGHNEIEHRIGSAKDSFFFPTPQVIQKTEHYPKPEIMYLNSFVRSGLS